MAAELNNIIEEVVESVIAIALFIAILWAILILSDPQRLQVEAETEELILSLQAIQGEENFNIEQKTSIEIPITIKQQKNKLEIRKEGNKYFSTPQYVENVDISYKNNTFSLISISSGV